MITVLCTKQLGEMLPEMPGKVSDEVPALFRWCAKIISVRNRKTLVAFCADNRFGFVLWGIKKAQLKDLPSLMRQGIRETLMHYSVRQEIVDDYAEVSSTVCLGMSRSEVARLNRAALDAEAIMWNGMSLEFLPLQAIHLLNDTPVDYAKGEGYYPYERMLEELEAHYGMKPICRPAYEIEASLDLEIHVAKRTLIVPTQYTFRELHRALQAAFGWQDYHLYDFAVGKERIFPGKDEFSSGTSLAEEVVLSDYLKVGTDFSYTYDYGDNWEISLRVKSQRSDYDQPWPVCTACEGVAPPEDVGGVPGFLAFIEAWNDPEHPDHQSMREWAGYGWMPGPSLNWINSSLRR